MATASGSSSLVTASEPLLPVGRPARAPGASRPWAAAATRLRAPHFTAARILGQSLLILGLLLVNRLGLAGTAVFFGVLSVMIVRNASSAFLALLIAGLGLATNEAIVPKNALWTVGRLAIIFVCCARFAIDLSHSRRSFLSQPYFVTLALFVAVAAVCSLVSGYFPHIALLKLVSFSVGLTAVLGGIEAVRDRDVDLTAWLIAIVGVVAISGSLMLASGRGYGLLDDGTSLPFFKGPFLHANSCGPYSALLGVLLFSTWLFTPRRGRWICLALLVPLLCFIWLSKSRTGGFSFVAGLFIMLALTYMPAARRYLPARLNMSRGTLLVAAALIAMVVVMVELASFGAVTEGLRGFLFKYGADVETGSILSSRQQVMEFTWRSFLQRPVFGLGFGVAMSEYFINNASIWTAPVEKGFLPLAVLEEVGILGAGPFAMFVLALVGSLWRRRNAVGLAMLLTYLVTNLGEVTFFSLAGWGLLGWMIVAAGVLIGDRCVVLRHQPRLQPVVR